MVPIPSWLVFHHRRLNRTSRKIALCQFHHYNPVVIHSHPHVSSCFIVVEPYVHGQHLHIDEGVITTCLANG